MAIAIVRRHFITALGGAIATWPLAAGAQQPREPSINIGVLNRGIPLQNFVAGNSSCDVVNDHRHRYSRATNACFAMANRGIHTDSLAPVMHRLF